MLTVSENNGNIYVENSKNKQKTIRNHYDL